MFSIDVPKDIRKIKPKLIGLLTLRQTIWGLIGGVCGYIGVAVQKSILGPDTTPNGGITILFCIIPAVIGFIPIMDLPAEQYMKLVFLNKFVFPKTRLCNSGNLWKQIYKKANEDFDRQEELFIKEKMKTDKKYRKTELEIRKQQKKQIKEADREFLKKYPPLR